jgi:hypothetical protein
MIILGNTKFIVAPFTSEQELENVVQANSEFIFGPDSFYLPKALIRTFDGAGTIPDGFVVDLATRKWFLVEAELGIHSVWNHIAPQVAKQIIAASQPDSRRALTELVVNRIKDNPAAKEKFEALEIREIDIRQCLSDIFETRPVVGIPIDEITTDLKEWAQTLKTEVKLWVIRKLVEFGNPANVMYEIPDEFRPAFDTSPESEVSDSGKTSYDVSMADLIGAGLFAPGQVLSMVYRARGGGDRKQYHATVCEDGGMEVLGRTFAAPSDAALTCLQDAGSERSHHQWMDNLEDRRRPDAGRSSETITIRQSSRRGLNYCRAIWAACSRAACMIACICSGPYSVARNKQN